MTNWKSNLENKVNLAEKEVQTQVQKISELENTLSAKLKADNEVVEKLNSQLETLDEVVSAKIDPILHAANEKFSTLKEERNQEIQGYIQEKLQEVEILIKAQKLQTKKDVDELKQQYLKEKIDKTSKAAELIRSVSATLDEKTKQLDKLLYDTALAKDAITQESLSRKNFELAEEKNQNANKAKTMLLLTACGITLLLAVLFSQALFAEKKPDLLDTLFRITFATPLGLFGLFQTYVYKREAGLRDHFHHKAISLASYSGFMTRIEEDDSMPADRKYKLLEDTFQQVLDNPADKLDKLEIKKISMHNKILKTLINTHKELLPTDKISNILGLQKPSQSESIIPNIPNTISENLN
jgi:hypothetical protein